MKPSTCRTPILPRRGFLQAAATCAMATGFAALSGKGIETAGSASLSTMPLASATGNQKSADDLFKVLDAQIEAAMAKYEIPGAAWCRHRQVSR